jgi:glycosyltransferase involved in cell wall biosynthesis
MVDGSNDVDVTVVMPCRNGARTIRGQLDALAQQDWSGRWEVVVSDNGSTDDTLSVLEGYRQRLPGLRVVDSSERAGVAHARNAGVVAAKGRSILFCDDDDEVGVGWLAAMGEALRDHDFVAATLETTKLNRSWMRNPSRRVGLRWMDPPFLPYAFGAVLGIWRSLHLEVGGFDEEFVGGADDIDYCFRVQLHGAELHWVPEAVTHYRIRPGLRGSYRQARSYSRGDVRLYKKYRPLGMRWHSPARAAKFWLLCGPRLLLALRSRTALGLWVWRFGRRVGFLEGSLVHRVLAL